MLLTLIILLYSYKVINFLFSITTSNIKMFVRICYTNCISKQKKIKPSKKNRNVQYYRYFFPYKRNQFDDTQERHKIKNRSNLLTNVTGFCRENQRFSLLKDHIFLIYSLLHLAITYNVSCVPIINPNTYDVGTIFSFLFTLFIAKYGKK